MTALTADRKEVQGFIGALFKHASPDSYLSLRVFPDKNNQNGVRAPAPPVIAPVKVSDPNLVDRVCEVIDMAAAQHDPRVFCPPVCTFKNDTGATTDDVAEGVALTVECDTNATAALDKLSSILGQPTAVVASGGESVNAVTGEVEPKLHLHWRLTEPTRSFAEHTQLVHARNLAAELVGADASAKPVVHPLRWPGSWHRKDVNNPRPARHLMLNPDNAIDLAAAIKRLELAQPKAGSVPKLDTAEHEGGADPYAPVEDIRAALRVIPNEKDRDGWVSVGMAVYRATKGAGFDAFDEWSRKWPGYDQSNTRVLWEGFVRTPPRRIGAGTIFRMASKADPYWQRAGAQAAVSDRPEGRPVVLQSSREFTANFTPPDYLVDGVLQRRFFYSCTAMTGAGKTAWALYIAACVALGRSVGRHGVERGTVCYFAGENPTDVQMRWIAMAEHMGFDETIDVHFVVGKFAVGDIKAAIAAKAKEIGCEFALIVVDTSATYFPGDDENANKQAGDHARTLRGLVELPGGPCVIALCHPTKNADADNLLPRGGGAYVAEVDGNLTAKLNGTVVEVHWQGKYRGPDFDPTQFELVHPIYARRLRDSKDRPIPTVIMRSLSDSEYSQVRAASRAQEDTVLIILADAQGVSLADIAVRAGWVSDGRPAKARAQRVVDRLRQGKLVKLGRNGWTLTDAGKQAAKEAKNT
jgi:hypothetical protein